MKNLFGALVALFSSTFCFSQTTKVKAEKYPSLLWEISGKGLSSPSYLFGTMHVSSKMAFHLSDSFYLGIQNAQVVALETNPGTWQEDFSRYDLDGESLRNRQARIYRTYNAEALPQDYLSINSLRLPQFEKGLEAVLYSSPPIINSFLYRSNTEAGSDYEEDTYLDLHIFQTGRKLGKKICGVEDFDGSMQLVKEAYSDAAKEKKRPRNNEYDNELSYARLEEAYRTGNLDLLDTINKFNSQSAAFDEKFLYRRNEIQAASIDSILRSGSRLFVGVGAAHLPGRRGVIEILRRKGYKLRPIKMVRRDGHHKESLEKLRVPVQFTKQVAEDHFYSVSVPGKLYSFGRNGSGVEMKQFADMINGSYYMVTRFFTDAATLGQSALAVEGKLDSVLYENIAGKILVKKAIVKNGYRGYDITARTRRGDVQRYNIFITPFEILLFKMSGNGDYVQRGEEATRFFQSIQLASFKTEWKNWSPASGGFAAEMPHQPHVVFDQNKRYAAFDPLTKTAVEIVRTDVHNYNFLEEDSFDLALMEESFASSESIGRNLSKQWLKIDGYPALEARYRNKDSSVTAVRFLIQGPHYYTVIATAPTETKTMERFLRSFGVKPFVYGEAKSQKDTLLQYTVASPVALHKESKLQLYPDEAYLDSEDADDSLTDNGSYQSRTIESDSTGEKIYVSYFKPSPYYFSGEETTKRDSVAFVKEWTVRNKKLDTLANGLIVYEYELGNRQSSRMLKGKTFIRKGLSYNLETELDTLSKQTSFVRRFFDSFQPSDTTAGSDGKTKKTALFFSQFFSADTLLHKKAVKNVGLVDVDSDDFLQLKKSIESLTWKEKAYLSVKKDFIAKLAAIKTATTTDYLKNLYAAAGDTAELQTAVLETLLGQQTAYAYRVFGDILQSDPPVLDESNGNTSYAGHNVRYRQSAFDDKQTPFFQNGNFFDNLTDSLQLTAGIVKGLLPLLNISDYEQPLMELLGALVDSNLIRPAEYEAYLPTFVLKAKQALKNQLSLEKAKAIETAKQAGDKDSEPIDRLNENNDYGNNKLSLYATLLLPFWDRNPQVPLLVSQLLRSSDHRLRYNTVLLLLRNHRSVPDSIIGAFAAMDDYRYELYTDLTALNKTSIFPTAFAQQLHMARSRLLHSAEYSKPDTLAYLDKRSLDYKGQKGVLYFFKYREKADNSNWKIGVAGLLPADSTAIEFSDRMLANDEEEDLDFTDLTGTKLLSDTPLNEQLDKLCKKLVYGRRKSAARFYEDEDGYGNYGLTRMQD